MTMIIRSTLSRSRTFTQQQNLMHAAPAFSRHLWTVINYSESDDEWLSQLFNCVEYIRDAKGKTSKPVHEVDVAVICALSEPELSAVLELPWNFQPARPIDDLTFIHEGHFVCNNKEYTVCALAAPRMGMVSASLTTLRVIERMRPKLIVMAGICAGIKGKSNLGDVVFADPCDAETSPKTDCYQVGPPPSPAPRFRV